MARATQKTTENTNSVPAFVETIEDPQRKAACRALIRIMQSQSGFTPKMWGNAIIGFGSYHYKYKSGHEGDAPLVAFSPRKDSFSLYTANFEGKDELLKNFGKHKKAKACVSFKSIEDINKDVLGKLITGSVNYYRVLFP